MKDISTANFVKISLENPGVLQHPTEMDLSRPCIFILGGENTDTPHWAQNYCITLAKTLYLNNIKSGLDIYSVYYKLRSRKSDLDRLNLFREFRDTKSLLDYGNGLTMSDFAYMNQSYQLSGTYPSYMYDIINFAFIPRILGRCDQMQAAKKIEENFKNMMVYTHCHGAYALLMVEKYLHQESNRFAYSLQDMYNIQKSLLVINHAPFAPVEQSKFHKVSFVSAADTQINYYNELSYHMRTSPAKFKPAFYGQKFGNIVITSQIKRDITKEHSQVGLSGDPRDEHELTENGKILFAIERNALLAGVRAMLTKKPIPKVSELICAPGYDFNELKSRGQAIYAQMGIRTR